MDNFMDKLALRYNAGEMIKANSQAEAAQMEGLQEQVEAYEAVLQEMRKLNYKNTELTEKMYSLVDESIEKVRTLQIEASENGANAEMISREMSDAVTGALNEALNNMDSTVAKTISESLATALAQPTEEIKQSAIATENVKAVLESVSSKFDSLDQKVDGMTSVMDGVNGKFDAVTTAVDSVNGKFDAVTTAVDSVSGKLDAVTTAVDGVNGRFDAVSTLADSVNGRFDELALMVDAVNDKFDGLSAGLSQIESGINAGFAQASSEASQETATAVPEINIDNSEILNSIATLSLAQEANGALLSSINARLEENSTRDNENSIDTTAFVAGVNDSLGATNTLINGVNDGVSQIADKLNAVHEAVAQGNVTSASVYESLAQNGVSINSVNESLAAMSEKINSTDTYVRGIWDSVEGQKSAIAAIVTGSSPSDVSDDVKMAIMDVSSSVEEVRTGMRNLKAAQDESKNTLKTSLDSAIYGLKQDNREIVEFMQRMNTNIVSATNDPDKARREEEAKIRDEELKRSLDERFKAQEDFVHKESVKVYRNVQAVINEKTDRQTDGIDSIIKKNTAQMNQVKVIAIIAAALSGIDIVLQVLKMFGVI